jgi:hypothetical protein
MNYNSAHRAGAAEGGDLLIFSKQDQKIAAFGSSYRIGEYTKQTIIPLIQTPLPC